MTKCGRAVKVTMQTVGGAVLAFRSCEEKQRFCGAIENGGIIVVHKDGTFEIKPLVELSVVPSPPSPQPIAA